MRFLHYLLFFVLNGLIQNFAYSQSKEIDATLDYAWEVKYSNTDTSRYILNSIIVEGYNENNAQSFAKAHSFLGVIEDIAGNSQKAIEHLLEARSIQETLDFKEDLSFTYNNLGVAFFYQYDYEKALEYYFMSSEIDKELGDEKGVAGTLTNIGIVYTYLDSMDRAREMYLEADDIYTLRNDSVGKTQVALNMAKIYFANQEFENAILEYKKASIYSQNDDNPELLINTFHGMANTYLKMSVLDSALHYCNLSNSYALSYNLRERLQYGYELLSEIYMQSNEYEKSIKALKKYTVLRDSLVNEDRNRSIVEMQTKYESEKKDRLIAEIELEKLANEKERNFFVALSLIVLLAVILLGFAYRFNKRKNVLLHERNKAVEDNLQQKETMIGEIHHRIKNNLQLISSIFDLQSRTLKDEEAIKAINDCKNRVKSMAIIHQKLYQQSDIYGINMHDYIENLSSGIVHTFNSLDQKIEVNHDIEDIILHIDTSIPIGLIITEIITNSLKYAFPNKQYGNVYISLYEKKNKLILEVRDDGVGIGNSKPNDFSTSFGMKMIKSLARQLKAEWDIIDKGGTKYKFEILNYKKGEQK